MLLCNSSSSPSSSSNAYGPSCQCCWVVQERQTQAIQGYGLPSDGVPLQRNLSRVPYNQAAINDVNNPAWIFSDGILEKVLNIARKRGHITGNQYILERVNIINGNGYNLFKPDGTYLWYQCQNWLFRRKRKGHSDALDY